MKYRSTLVLLVGALQFSGPTLAQQGLAASFGLYVYPSNGQAASQQAKDEGECYTWGKQTTGVDPANPMAGVQAKPAPQAVPPGAAAAGGGMKGAAAGALIGNLADEDAGEYALAGALIGGVRGNRKAQKQNAEAQQQASAQSQEQTKERVQIFKNAFSACMEGRKYTVK
jgi:hypothetical protein